MTQGNEMFLNTTVSRALTRFYLLTKSCGVSGMLVYLIPE